MKPTYLLLHRALRNAGDFLIFERARRLIASVHPAAELLVAKAWQPLTGQLPVETIRGCQAIVVCGGPGYSDGMAERYPLGELTGGPPLVLMALGSHVVPGTDAQLAATRFDPQTRGFLDSVLARFPFLGARDRLTADLLGSNGYDRVLMTGDPAWYDLERIDAPLLAPTAITSIAITPPANPVYFRQAIELFEAVAARHHPARVTVVHHRGIQRPFVRLANAHGWQTRDITGDLAGFAVFDEHDLHLGYRVHAHLYATSRGRVSYLVAEDSRGTGVHRTLGQLGASGFDDRAASPAMGLALRHLPRLGNASRALTDRVGVAVSRLLPVPSVAEELAARLGDDLRAVFPAHVHARDVIRATLPTMRRMIENLPGDVAEAAG
jgi:hypothetical protein